jgi:thiopurine S-methyltransferase
MEEKFWQDKWRKNEIGFHQASVHPSLIKFADRLPLGKIFVPLCGKTLDMLYLRKLGHEVVGVEFSEIACRSFMLENKLEFMEERKEDFILFRTEGIELWCGDFFSLPNFFWKDITGVYDRASLVALPLETRKNYAHFMQERLPSKVSILLVTFEYSYGLMEGPPFSISKSELELLYPDISFEKIFEEKAFLRAGRGLECTYWASRE